MRDEARRTLRAATYRGDGAAVLAALGNVDIELALQLAGRGVLTALAQVTPGAVEVADRFTIALRQRGWEGDAELIAELDHARGSAAGLDLVELAVDLDELSSALEDDRLEGGAINLESGEVWPAPALDYLAEFGEQEPDLEDADVWLVVHASYSSQRGYLDMEAFIETIDDPAMVDRLSIALDGKGAFRRFRSVLERDDDLVSRWIAFSEERRLGRARAWLAEAGCCPLVRRPPQSVE